MNAPMTPSMPRFDTSIHAENPPATPQIRIPMMLTNIEPRGNRGILSQGEV
jgi:hypothetical protein